MLFVLMYLKMFFMIVAVHFGGPKVDVFLIETKHFPEIVSFLTFLKLIFLFSLK